MYNCQTQKKLLVNLLPFYGDPTSKLELVGVTGTNGKTTIATLLYNMFRLCLDIRPVISTVCNYIDGEAIPTDHTTPDPITLNQLLGRIWLMKDANMYSWKSVHILLYRNVSVVWLCRWHFHEITRDHLDYHKTFENYLKARKHFWQSSETSFLHWLTWMTRTVMVMTQNTKAKVAAYSLHSLCDFKGKVLEDSLTECCLTLITAKLNVQFIGRFNASNLLAVYGAACLLGNAGRYIGKTEYTSRPVSGRFDAKRSPKGYTAIVDYAHTPDALVNVLEAIHEVLRGRGQVITVVGAGEETVTKGNVL